MLPQHWMAALVTDKIESVNLFLDNQVSISGTSAATYKLKETSIISQSVNPPALGGSSGPR